MLYYIYIFLNLKVNRRTVGDVYGVSAQRQVGKFAHKPVRLQMAVPVSLLKVKKHAGTIVHR